MPGLQKLAFAGKGFEDSQRTLEQYAPSAALACAPIVRYLLTRACRRASGAATACATGTPSSRTGPSPSAATEAPAQQRQRRSGGVGVGVGGGSAVGGRQRRKAAVPAPQRAARRV
jgi:hypothetical protein